MTGFLAKKSVCHEKKSRNNEHQRDKTKHPAFSYNAGRDDNGGGLGAGDRKGARTDVDVTFGATGNVNGGVLRRDAIGAAAGSNCVAALTLTGVLDGGDGSGDTREPFRRGDLEGCVRGGGNGEQEEGEYKEKTEASWREGRRHGSRWRIGKVADGLMGRAAKMRTNPINEQEMCVHFLFNKWNLQFTFCAFKIP